MEPPKRTSSVGPQPSPEHPGSSLWPLWAAVALGLALRVGAVVAFEELPAICVGGRVMDRPATHPMFPDTIEYLRVAEHIRHGQGLAVSNTPTDVCLIGRMPGYPVFLALIQGAFGESMLAVRLAQAVVGTVLIALVWLLARELCGEREAHVAAAIAALYPPFILYTVLALSETVFTTLLVWGVLWLARGMGSGRWLAAVLAGVLLGLATLVRASLLMFIGLAAVAWVLGGRLRWGAMGRAGLMLAAFAATMAPWVVRNWSASGGHVVVTTLRAGASLYEALNPRADGGPMMDQINWDWGTKGLSEWERDRLWRQRAIEFARENPGRVLTLAVRKLGRFWNPMPNAAEFQSRLLLAAIAPPFVAAAALGLLGLLASRRRGKTLLILLLPVVYYSGLHTVFVSSIRYRDPVMPFILILAACGVTRLWGGQKALPAQAQLTST